MTEKHGPLMNDLAFERARLYKTSLLSDEWKILDSRSSGDAGVTSLPPARAGESGADAMATLSDDVDSENHQTTTTTTTTTSATMTTKTHDVM